MAKKDVKPELKEEFKQILEKTIIKNVNVEDEMKKSFIAYAMAVNVSRAIPDVRDGLKPVHRRILYSMNELGITHDKPFRKCARIVGDVLGKYHPHGDSSVYDALVRLAQSFSINFPLIDGHGNFGSVDGDSAAAMRYTEARLSKLASEMLREIDKETVDSYPNFDDTLMQPTVLPARFPNLLVNGADGIAVGMATSIPPHNLVECIDATIALIDNPEITVEELMNYVPAPDYPTGGIIMGRTAIKQAYRTGRGGVVLRAKTEIEEFNNGTRNRIIVTELPYQVNKAKLIETIADYVKDKKIEGISDIQDNSDRDGMRIVIDVKRDANAQVVLNTLFKHTNLQVSNGITLLALVNGEPKVLSLKECLHYYILHQKEVIERRTKYDLEKAEEREHIVNGLIIALANIDEVVATLKASKDRPDATAKLMQRFELSDKQAGAILDMRLQRLTSLEVEKLQAEQQNLIDQIADFKDILASESRVMAIVKNDLTEIKEKYPSERRTEISVADGDLLDADLIEEEDVVISMTHAGYIKRMAVDEYRAQNRGGRGVTAHKTKDEDFVERMFVCSTHDDVLFFTNFGKVYAIKGFEVPEAQKNARGRAMVNLLQVSEGEKVTAVVPRTKDTAAEGYLVMATAQGLIKKTALSEFESIRKVGKIAISLNEGDSLIQVEVSGGDNEIIVASHNGKCIRFSENDVRPMGRDTHGVRSIELAEGDYVVDMVILQPDAEIITITENGYGKRSPIEDYRLQTRAGKGIKAGVFNAKTGLLVSLKQVKEDNDVMMICENGIVIRIHANQISKIGRDTQGVRIMRVENTKISNVAIAPREEDEPEEGEIAEGETAPVAEETAPVAEETTAVAQEAAAPEENGSAE
ncbi:MAG: DNA gyrase subunit A [Clostridia bacterium]|nr:DNA gyrase subunit A [Clostridia bacterium]